jgi:hypothetical protein
MWWACGQSPNAYRVAGVARRYSGLSMYGLDILHVTPQTSSPPPGTRRHGRARDARVRMCGDIYRVLRRCGVNVTRLTRWGERRFSCRWMDGRLEPQSQRGEVTCNEMLAWILGGALEFAPGTCVAVCGGAPWSMVIRLVIRLVQNSRPLTVEQTTTANKKEK